ncbi:hypothetical protein ACFL1Y_02070 [Patescibacteria group bacterium]
MENQVKQTPPQVKQVPPPWFSVLSKGIFFFLLLLVTLIPTWIHLFFVRGESGLLANVVNFFLFFWQIGLLYLFFYIKKYFKKRSIKTTE